MEHGEVGQGRQHTDWRCTSIASNGLLPRRGLGGSCFTVACGVPFRKLPATVLGGAELSESERRLFVGGLHRVDLRSNERCCCVVTDLSPRPSLTGRVAAFGFAYLVDDCARSFVCEDVDYVGPGD